MAELIVTAIVLTSIMSLTTGLCFRISLIWKDVGHRRVAVAELSNQLDRLTSMKPETVRKEIETLAASDHCQRTLRDPKLIGTLVESELGTQLNLQLNWNREHPGKPIALSGWLVEENH